MTARRVAGGFSSKRLARVRELLERHVDSGFVPGVMVVLARHGAVHLETTGTLAFEGAGSRTPMAGDTICRLGSMTKPIVAACAMTLVEDCTLRLDDPVDDLLPELAEMTVLADPNGPLDDTVAATRPITLRDLLAYTLGTGMVPAEPGTVPISDALGVLGRAAPPEEWMRRLGTLPLVHQPGERWMYNTAADVTGVLIARATGRSFGDALRERICGPLGMKDTAFSVGGEGLGRLATAYERDNAVTGEPIVDDGPDGRWSRPPVFEGGGGGLVSTAEDYLAFASSIGDGELIVTEVGGYELRLGAHELDLVSFAAWWPRAGSPRTRSRTGTCTPTCAASGTGRRRRPVPAQPWRGRVRRAGRPRRADRAVPQPPGRPTDGGGAGRRGRRGTGAAAACRLGALAVLDRLHVAPLQPVAVAGALLRPQSWIGR